MNQVQLLKSRFEKLEKTKLNVDIESLDITPIRHKSEPPIKFSRSATCIDFSKLNLKEEPKEERTKIPFQRQTSNSSSSSYKSIRRSPAFRHDAQARPSVVKSVTKEVPAKKADFDELEYLATSATIKKALLKPLPTGSPPKKPPRIFHSPQLTKRSGESPKPSIISSFLPKLKISPNTLPKTATKTEAKKPIGSFLNCIISPCSIDPIYYEQIKKEQREKRQEETIYMEPFAHLTKDFVNNNSKVSPASEELHYMCTDLNPPPTDSNGNHSKEEQSQPRRNSLETSDLEDYEKVTRNKVC